MKQVQKDAYRFESYSHSGRFVSYFHQLKYIHRYSPQTVLEIGVGDGVVGSFIKQNTEIKYTSLDVAEDLHPDIVGSVTKLPFEDNTFDISCAFEVLEHIPFDQFETAVSELMRVSKKAVLISLPHFGPPLQFLLKIPLIPKIQFSLKLPFPKKHIFNGQHFFEIGKKDFPVSRISSILKKHGKLVEEYIPFENQYHHFFILEKINNTAV